MITKKRFIENGSCGSEKLLNEIKNLLQMDMELHVDTDTHKFDPAAYWDSFRFVSEPH